MAYIKISLVNDNACRDDTTDSTKGKSIGDLELAHKMYEKLTKQLKWMENNPDKVKVKIAEVEPPDDNFSVSFKDED